MVHGDGTRSGVLQALVWHRARGGTFSSASGRVRSQRPFREPVRRRQRTFRQAIGVHVPTTGRSLFEVTLAVARGVARVFVVGEVDLATAPEMRRHADEALATAGVSLVVIDLESCTYLDSAGLHVLVHVVESAKKRGQGVTVIAPGGIVRLVIEV